MIAPRWRKVLRDVGRRPGRSALAVLAMTAGVFQIGAMLYKYALLQPELTTMYGRTRPASATLLTDAVDDAVVDAVRRMPSVADAEARPVVIARVRVGADEWVPAVLYVVRDFDRQRIDTFDRDTGAWPPGPGDVLLERSALRVARVAVDDSLTLRLGGETQTLRVAGTVHASGLAPAWMEHMVPGFVGWDSSIRGDARGESAQLRIVVADHPLDEGYIREVADSVKAMLERRGHVVSRVTVPPPGRHPHADQMEAFLFLLLAFGILSFALSTVLVASMIHALMSEQVREVGIMKALGATDGQVASLYLGQVSILATAALAIGIPLGLVVGRAYAEFAAGILNADLTDRPFPVWLIVAEVVVGLVVPLLVALGPVRRAARITVREALSDGPSPGAAGARRLDRWLAAIPGLSRPLALMLRTTFLRRGRLALTVVTLAIGGAVFIAALNVSTAWKQSVEADFARRRFDLTVLLAGAEPIARLDAILAAVPDVARAEYWPGASPWLIGANGVPGNTVAVIGPDADSPMLAPALLAGRWLTPGVPGAVVNQAVLTRNPTLGVGRPVQVRLAGRTASWPIVGIAKELAPMPVIYADPSLVRALTGRPADETRSIRIATRAHDETSGRATAAALERAFAREGIEVALMQRTLDAKQGILDHLVIIMAILTMAATIVVFVGALALASTLGLSVVQRTREIGVLGAIGATPATIGRHVWFEGVLIGLLSWVAANVLGAPLSWGLEAACGEIFFKVPLDFTMSPAASGAWLLLVLVIATLSSLQPAFHASRLTVREALAHA